MQLTRFARALGLFLMIGVVGCGSESQRVALDAEDENGMLVARKGIRSHNRELRESKASSANGKTRKPQVKP
jgi:hypothetical protein